MALRALLLRSRLDAKKKSLQELREKDPEFEKREKELEEAIGEMTEDTSDEDREAVEKQAEEFQKEKNDHEKEKKDLEEEIEGIEEEIRKEEEKQPKPGREEERGGNRGMEERRVAAGRGNFYGLSIQERDAMMAREDVKGFLSRVRECIKEKRALTNVGLTIPDVMLPMIRQVTEETSKLMKHVTVQQVSGTARQNIMGEIPEGIWDEMCASIKELDLAFYNMEMDGYKVSGYFAVCNATLEDSDVALAAELINALGKAIGKAVDKAILYGKNVKMPMGIVTSLLLQEAPEKYPATGRTWEDLSTSHVITGKTATGIALFQDIVTASGIIDNDYDTNAITWVMNKKTHTKLIAESMGVNSAAAIVAGMSSMPVIGGAIEELKYIPDDTIIFGYFGNYKLVERAGTKIAQSEHARFLEDQTVFKGTARYDGDLAIREAFAVYGIGKAPTTTAPAFAGE
mgnify:CR=1 FL=1